MPSERWTATHLLRWIPDLGPERTWSVRLVRVEISSRPWWLAQSLDEHLSARPPEWEYEAAADRWTWRGLDGFRGARGTVRCDALDTIERGSDQSRRAALRQGLGHER